MKSFKQLPEGYGELLTVNLQKDKKLALLINGLALIIAAAMVVPMLFIVPIGPLFNIEEDNFLPLVLRIGALAVSSIAYIILHELVHGAAMKLCGTEKVKYGFTGLYAFAGSSDYYTKGSYIFIALAPVVLWGAVLAVINAFVPTDWFWVVYIVQVFNISGAAGDYYVTVKFCKLPKDVLVSDNGVAMTVYAD